MVALDESHGIETLRTKVFMRASAIVSDVVVYFSAAIAFALVYHRGNAGKQIRAMALLLLQPTLILVDHGHFQYNAVSLGLTLWAVVCVLADRDVLGSIFFVLAINYKQMALYYAPAFFFFLLGKCLVDQPTVARARQARRHRHRGPRDHGALLAPLPPLVGRRPPRRHAHLPRPARPLRGQGRQLLVRRLAPRQVPQPLFPGCPRQNLVCNTHKKHPLILHDVTHVCACVHGTGWQ